MKSARLIISLLATALLFDACTQVSVLSFREMPTLIEPDDAVAVVVSGEITDLASDAEGCVNKAIKETFPTLRIISSDDFYRIALPEAEKSVRASTDISVLLKEPDFRERIRPLGLRYLVVVAGGTQQQGKLFGGGACGLGAAITAFGWSGERQSSLWASVLDLKKYLPAGHVLLEASGKPWWTCVGIGPFCMPFGAAAFTESAVCEKVGEAVVVFLKGEEVEIPTPLWIVLAPKVRPLETKLGSAEKLFSKVVDKRKHDFLGYWQNSGGSRIRNSNSLETVVDETLRTELSNLGFELLDSPVVSWSNLELTIEHFWYWLADLTNVDAQVTAVLYQGGQRTFEKTYTINNTFNTGSNFANPTWIAEKINVTLSDILYKVLTDEELLLMLCE